MFKNVQLFILVEKTYEYKMNGTTLNQNSMEKDLGILIQSDLKPSEQCIIASRKATQALFLIQKSFLYKDQKTFVLLYKQFVRCHLKYASPVWSPMPMEHSRY